MHADFYKTIPPEQLETYAATAGIGGENPLDLQIMAKYLTGLNRVLEVGCGTGRLGRLLVTKYDYVGIDVHQPYLDYFANWLKEASIDPEQHIFLQSFLSMGNMPFDAILFPWSVIGDFDSTEQTTALVKSREMLNKNGVVILDNPAKGSKYNTAAGYTPTLFYFDDWESKFANFGFSKYEKVEYDTPVGRRREMTILYA